MNYVFLLLAFIAGYAFGQRRSAHAPAPATEEQLDEMREESRIAIDERTEHRKEKILELMRHEEEHFEDLKVCDPAARERFEKGIVRADVEALLGVSRKTALAYLDELEEEGAVRQQGSGRDARYVLGE